MENKLTIEDMVVLKKEAAIKIKDILSDFEYATGLNVSKVHFVRIDPLMPLQRAHILNVEFEIDI